MASKNSRPTDVRKRILEEAIRLFGENGFEGTSLKAIADAVGIRNPSLLYHFGTKEQLREEVISDMLTHWKEELPGLLANATDSEDRFASLIESVVKFFSDDPNRARLTIREMLDRPKEIGAQIREHLGPWIKLIADYIRQGQEAGTSKKEVDPELFIFQVVLMVAGTVAFNGVAATIMGTDDTVTSLRPNIGHLIRIARNALFVEPGPL